MIILPCLPFLWSFNYVTGVFLLAFIFGILYHLFFKRS